MSELEAPPPPVPAAAPSADMVMTTVQERIHRDVPSERQDAMSIFAKAVLRRLSEDELEGLGAEHWFALVASAFAFVDDRRLHSSAVRIFHPIAEHDGYATAGTIIETNTDDSPFLVDSVSEELQARGIGSCASCTRSSGRRARSRASSNA